jgi:hypothetical protein
VTKLQWKLVLVRLETVLILTQYRCTAYAECTIVSKIILDAPVKLQGDVHHVESRFDPFGHGVCVATR